MDGDSALVRILGVFQVQCEGNYSTNLVLMENITESAQVKGLYDLKGCLYRRNSKGEFLVGKDLNFLQLHERLSLTAEAQKRLKDKLAADTEMLKRLKLMDYSLLVVVCFQEDIASTKPNYYYASTIANQHYLIALIDFFQVYNLKKKLERSLKKLIFRAPSSQISVIDPQRYQDRFLKFVDSIID
mmetsp:Transcript_5792/g.10327  ORF Transcript_5792/g.10327 Transcript_5792/m.10327 type:complete len:186 (+) Transcript_5792:1-558(+)